jgi:hypothetical protein
MPYPWRSPSTSVSRISKAVGVSVSRASRAMAATILSENLFGKRRVPGVNPGLRR